MQYNITTDELIWNSEMNCQSILKKNTQVLDSHTFLRKHMFCFDIAAH